MHDGSKELLFFYLGDHDPSGMDMVRDIQDRFRTFGIAVELRKVALTIEQVNQYNPPPDPAKVADPRAVAYVEAYGESCWEVDALPPNVLTQLINEAIEEIVDHDALDKVQFRGCLQDFPVR